MLGELADPANAAYTIAQCLSVCLSCSCILSKQVHTSSNFFHRLVAAPFNFFQAKHYGNMGPS